MTEANTKLKLVWNGEICEAEAPGPELLDGALIAQVQAELLRVVETHAGIRLIVSFRKVTHLSSAALGMLTTLRKQVQLAKGRLKISDLDGPLLEVFNMTGLSRILDICATSAEAQKSF